MNPRILIKSAAAELVQGLADVSIHPFDELLVKPKIGPPAFLRPVFLLLTAEAGMPAALRPALAHGRLNPGTTDSGS